MLFAKPANLNMHVAYVDEHISQRFWNITKRKAPRCMPQRGFDLLHAYVDEHISEKLFSSRNITRQNTPRRMLRQGPRLSQVLGQRQWRVYRNLAMFAPLRCVLTT